MNRNNDKISSFQLGMMISITIVGVGILTIPRSLTEKVGPDGWIVLSITVLLALGIGRIFTTLVEKFYPQNMVEYSNSLVGKILGTLIALSFCIYLVIFTSFELRIFGEITKAYLLFNTPIEVLMITLLLTATYLVRSGIESIVRMAQLLFPFVIIFAILITIPVLGELHFSNLLPVFKTPISKIIQAIPITFFSFVGIEMIMVCANFVVDPENIKKDIDLSVLIVAGIYMFIVVVTVSRFGLVETTHIIWPSLELFKTIDLPGAFIENIQIFVIAVWIITVFMTVVPLYFGASLTLSRIFKSKEQNYLVLFLIPFIYFIALIPENIAQLGDYADKFSYYLGTLHMVIIPSILLLLSYIKKKEGGKGGV
ncbi:GerAB/ArcD/ProY family transporter [Inediibacterium massiliense]|uniref:GerAB/ArcD/ProY family transporter n=1 Tax=Inediibacterium massiliense TaxID=1658111 RepID=UPI0006B5E2E5|nr:endospore germination permease [Inediibacterium massiliense]